MRTSARSRADDRETAGTVLYFSPLCSPECACLPDLSPGVAVFVVFAVVLRFSPASLLLFAAATLNSPDRSVWTLIAGRPPLGENRGQSRVSLAPAVEATEEVSSRI